MNAKQQQLFNEGSVWKAILTMAVPAAVTMLVMILYNVADMFFVGQTGDTAQVAAVSLISPVFTVLMAIGSMIGGGGCALIARTLGEKDTDKVRLYSSLCCWGSIVFGLLFGGAVLLLRTPLLTFLGTNADTVGFASTYLTVLAFGAPVMVFTVAYGNVLRGEGAVKDSMIGNMLSTAVNMVLDPIFILVLHLGVGGAAIATVLGNAVGAVYLIHYVCRGKSSFSLAPHLALKNPMAIGKIVSIGLPNFVNSTLVGIASAFANNLLVQYGTIAVAAMAASSKATMILSMLQMGITMGVQPLLAFSYGANDTKRLKELLVKMTLLTVAIGGIVTLFCVVNGNGFLMLFLKEAEALALGRRMIRLLVLSGPFLGLYYISSSFLQAAGNAPLATLVSMLRQGILLIPMLYVMNQLFGVTGNVCAHLAADLTSTIIAVVLALYQYRKLNSGATKVP